MSKFRWFALFIIYLWSFQATAQSDRLITASSVQIGSGSCQTTRGRVLQREDRLIIELLKPTSCSFQSLDIQIDGRIYRMDGVGSGFEKTSSGNYTWKAESALVAFTVSGQISTTSIANARISEVGCGSPPHCLTDGLISASSVTSRRSQESCNQLAKVSCTEANAKAAANIMCRAVKEGCEKVSERVEATASRILVRNFCAVQLTDLQTRTDGPGRVLNQYRFNEGNAVGQGVAEIGKKMQEEGNIVSSIYGLILQGMGSGINAGTNAGKGDSCEPEYIQACRQAQETHRTECTAR
jgi:hypothetical protein